MGVGVARMVQGIDRATQCGQPGAWPFRGGARNWRKHRAKQGWVDMGLGLGWGQGLVRTEVNKRKD